MTVSDTARITIRINAEEKELILQYAQDNDLTVSQVVRKAIRDFINKETNLD